MDQKKLKGYREKLVQKKKEMLEAYSKNMNYGKEADGEGAQDIADKASNSYTKEFLFSLSNSERDTLQLVDEALHRLEASTTECAWCARTRWTASGWRRCPGPSGASPARRSRSRACCDPAVWRAGPAAAWRLV